MTNALCLRCQNYEHQVVMLKYGEVSHPTMKWACAKEMYPIDCQDERGNSVADWCNEYKSRE